MGLQNLQGQSQHNLQGTWTTALEVSPELTPVHWYPSCIGGNAIPAHGLKNAK